MAFFGVELNAQVNKLNLQIKLNLSRNKTMPNFRTLYKGFFSFDKTLSGTVTPDQFEEVLSKNGLFLKKFEYQVYQKAYGDESGKVNWFSFLGNIREPLAPQRKQLVEKIFDSLDTEHKGAIHYKTLSKVFDLLSECFQPQRNSGIQRGKKDQVSARKIASYYG
jgi:Ca2+-binding EF-hand superfamily protein